MTRYRRAPDAVLKKVAGSGAVYLRSSGSLHVLNPTGELIVRALDEPASVDELAAALAGLTDAPPESLAGDLADFLPELAALGVLVAE